VKIALRETGVAFERVTPEGFGTGGPDTAFSAASSRTEVPLVINGEVAVFESTVIVGAAAAASVVCERRRQHQRPTAAARIPRSPAGVVSQLTLPLD
jgi:hypothetical protein